MKRRKALMKESVVKAGQGTSELANGYGVSVDENRHRVKGAIINWTFSAALEATITDGAQGGTDAKNETAFLQK